MQIIIQPNYCDATGCRYDLQGILRLWIQKLTNNHKKIK